MVDDKLTPEEEAELEALRQEDVQEAPLSPEEEMELQELRNPQEEEGFVESSVNTLTSASRKVAKGFLPITNQVAAGLSAMADYATDPIADAIYGTSTPPSTFGEKYNRNLSMIRNQEQEDNERLGLAGTGLEIAGAVVGLGKAAKLLNVTSKTAQGIVATGTLDAAYAAASYVDSQGYTGDVKEVMRNGMAFSMAAQVLAGPMARGAAGLGRKMLGKTDDALLAANVKRFADVTSDNVEEFKRTMGDDALRKTMDDFKMTDPDMAANPVKFKEHVKQTLSDAGDELGAAYSGLDVITGGVPIDALNVLDKVNKRVLGTVNSSAAKKELADTILPQIDAMFKNSIDGTYNVNNITALNETLLDLNQGNILSKVTGKPKEAIFKVLRDELKNARSKVVGQLDMGIQNSKKLDDLLVQQKMLDDISVAGQKQGTPMNAKAQAKLDVINSQIDELQKKGVKPKVSTDAETVLQNPDMLEGISKRLESANEKYARLAEFNKKILSQELPSTAEGYLVNALRNAFSAKGVMGAIAGGSIGGPAGAVIGASGIGISRKAASRASRFLEGYAGTTKEASVRRGVQRLSSFLDKTAQYNTDPVFRGLSAIVAKNMGEQEGVSADQAWVNIEGAISKANLYTNPLERSKDSVVTNFDDVMAFASAEAPQLAASLAEAMNNQEDVGPIMDALSKLPNTARYFKAGFGWDGKVYSEEDKQTIINEINAQLDVPSVKKNELIKSVKATGEIPDMNNIQRRQPMQYQQRDRSKLR